MVQLTSPTLALPRPGFPQRVTPVKRYSGVTVTADEKATASSPGTLNELNFSEPTGVTSIGTSQKQGPFDYLYEFSETRKVLEDFFKSPDDDDPAAHIDFATDSEYVSVLSSVSRILYKQFQYIHTGIRP